MRCWLGGVIPDINEAVDSPQHLTSDPEAVRRLLDLVKAVPMLVWGRDELRCDDMWNSNSMIAWLLARSGLDAAALRPPAGGRAPGWHAGLVAAECEIATPGLPPRPGAVAASSRAAARSL